MAHRFGILWLPRLLYRLTLALAVVLVALVLICPWLDDGAADPSGRELFVAVFARDVVLRRTALASAAGLVVTACVFFKPAPARGPNRPSRPPADVAGA
jgi:hypothetical protein